MKTKFESLLQLFRAANEVSISYPDGAGYDDVDLHLTRDGLTITDGAGSEVTFPDQPIELDEDGSVLAKTVNGDEVVLSFFVSTRTVRPLSITDLM
jgi:hypothetical protein